MESLQQPQGSGCAFAGLFRSRCQHLGEDRREGSLLPPQPQLLPPRREGGREGGSSAGGQRLHQGAASPEEGGGSPAGSGALPPPRGSRHWPQQHLCRGLSHHPRPGKFFPQGRATHQQSNQQGLGSRQPGCGEEQRLDERTSPRRALPLAPPIPPHRAESGRAARALGQGLPRAAQREMKAAPARPGTSPGSPGEPGLCAGQGATQGRAPHAQQQSLPLPFGCPAQGCGGTRRHRPDRPPAKPSGTHQGSHLAPGSSRHRASLLPRAPLSPASPRGLGGSGTAGSACRCTGLAPRTPEASATGAAEKDQAIHHSGTSTPLADRKDGLLFPEPRALQRTSGRGSGHGEKCPEGKKWPLQRGTGWLTLVIPLRETSSEPTISMHRA